ncbi:hypothetical protein CVT24_012564 [Panaeolus cyanescens]|uniref:Cofilin n=1 Tax=Panaeolus cyanescens TaxID=181874 RepID=A0A409WKW3_9AGAR|nr:hypothetical protein CVT24_012564 [Panaeolus cyanescens]
MASGVTVNEGCLSTFQELKLKKKYKFITFTLSPNATEIVVKDTSTEKDYDAFIESLPEDECRWAVYDVEFEKEDGGKRNKLAFISWVPETAKIKQKMIFASSRDALRRSLVGIQVEVQATEYAEVSYEIVLDKANRGH